MASLLRTQLVRAGPPPAHLDSPIRPVTTGRAISFAVRVGSRQLPWSAIQPHLRAALELDRPERQRSAEARYLAEFLHAEQPNPLKFVLARRRLNQIWDALQQHRR